MMQVVADSEFCQPVRKGVAQACERIEVEADIAGFIFTTLGDDGEPSLSRQASASLSRQGSFARQPSMKRVHSKVFGVEASQAAAADLMSALDAFDAAEDDELPDCSPVNTRGVSASVAQPSKSRDTALEKPTYSRTASQSVALARAPSRKGSSVGSSSIARRSKHREMSLSFPFVLPDMPDNIWHASTQESSSGSGFFFSTLDGVMDYQRQEAPSAHAMHQDCPLIVEVLPSPAVLFSLATPPPFFLNCTRC